MSDQKLPVALPAGPPPEQKPAARKWLLNLFALSLSLFFCFAALEIGARIYYSRDRENMDTLKHYRHGAPKAKMEFIDFIYPKHDSNMIYDLLPGQTGIFEGAQVVINADGMRDRRYTPQPAPDVFRIAGIGDSIAFGQGVELEETYLKILERMLNEFAGAPRYEVLNFGVPGYNTAMELAQFEEKVLAFAPRAVLFQFCGNDFDLPNFIRVKPDVRALNKSFGLFWLRERFARLRANKAPEGLRAMYLQPPPAVKGDDGYTRFSYVPDQVPAEYAELTGRGAFDRSMAEFGRVLDQRQLPTLYLPFCSWYDGFTKTGTLLDDPIVFAWLIPLAEKLHFIIADSSPDAIAGLQRWHAPDSKVFWVAKKDTHPNYLHNIIIAKTFFRLLVERQIIPDAKAWQPRLDEFLSRFDQLADQAYQAN